MLLASYNQSYGDSSSGHAILYDVMVATRAVISDRADNSDHYQSPCFVYFFVGAGGSGLGNTVSFKFLRVGLTFAILPGMWYCFSFTILTSGITEETSTQSFP